MTATIVRTFVPDLEIRSTAKGGDGRTIEGIAVPFGRVQRIDPTLTEQFARGAFNHQLRAPNRVRFSREHLSLGGTLIGNAVEMRDDAAGLWVALRASATPAGDETLELVKDGVLDELSVGFQERQNRRTPDGVIERVTANLLEVSVVLAGAYGRGATVEAVRAAGCTCGCTCGAGRRSDEVTRILAGLPALPPAA